MARDVPRRSVVQVAVGFHVPASVPRLDETENRPGKGGIAEYVGVIDRIDTVEAARLHKSAAVMAAIEKRPSRGAGGEHAQGGGGGKHDESLASTHVASIHVVSTHVVSIHVLSIHVLSIHVTGSLLLPSHGLQRGGFVAIQQGPCRRRFHPRMPQASGPAPVCAATAIMVRAGPFPGGSEAQAAPRPQSPEGFLMPH
jgi:hypothetical protein